ncbi:MAG: tRNA (N(6)-L-threonylcarbamoyladenosine(37)-C(2))-methylthiotransferase MtaB [Gammaproteobacteria bacterium]|nr:tRNA (N(6)-L-threonylcarbamoyladenosine(37)-C(2))-methylthiotransferase MtaB [Gammaproteobacteria bacterium]
MALNIHLSALGCRLNEAELNQWATEFTSKGHKITQSTDDADVFILNSCAVTAEAVRKSRQQLSKMHRDSPSAKIIATGCFATLEPERAMDCGVDLVVANADKSQLVAQTESMFDLDSAPAMAMEPEATLFARGRSRAFIKIQDGCRHRCSFCIVTVARGEEVSRPIDDIIKEINALYAVGIREIVIAGVHVGGYGSDLDTDLKALVEAILAKTDVPRIRFASVEPWNLPEGFFELFTNPRVMPHMHLPLQSGSNSVLKRMARRCRTEDFAELVATARASHPNFNITTDIICGFPGETEQEFADSLAFIESMNFGHIHVFPYSKREGTGAARMPNHLDNATKKQRVKEVEMLAKQSRQNNHRSLLGQQDRVLLENRTTNDADGRPLRFGYTCNYLRVAVKGTTEAGQIIDVRIDRLDASGEYLVAGQEV